MVSTPTGSLQTIYRDLHVVFRLCRRVGQATPNGVLQGDQYIPVRALVKGYASVEEVRDDLEKCYSNIIEYEEMKEKHLRRFDSKALDELVQDSELAEKGYGIYTVSFEEEQPGSSGIQHLRRIENIFAVAPPSEQLVLMGKDGFPLATPQEFGGASCIWFFQKTCIADIRQAEAQASQVFGWLEDAGLYYDPQKGSGAFNHYVGAEIIPLIHAIQVFFNNNKTAYEDAPAVVWPNAPRLQDALARIGIGIPEEDAKDGTLMFNVKDASEISRRYISMAQMAHMFFENNISRN